MSLTKTYTKPSRYNVRLSFEQYQLLLDRKREATESQKRIRYKDLTEAWGIRQSVIGTALQRGIKQYEYRIWKEGSDDPRRHYPHGERGGMGKTKPCK